MNTNLLIFFAIPIAVIVFSIVLQKLIRCPILVASIIFSILLIIVLAFFDSVYLIAVIAYTILSFITAYITMLICRFINNGEENSNCRRRCGCGNNTINGNNNGNNTSNDVIAVLSDGTILNGNDAVNAVSSNNGCNCNNNNNNTNTITATANFIPNTNNNGRTGSFSGCYRRR